MVVNNGFLKSGKEAAFLGRPVSLHEDVLKVAIGCDRADALDGVIALIRCEVITKPPSRRPTLLMG